MIKNLNKDGNVKTKELIETVNTLVDVVNELTSPVKRSGQKPLPPRGRVITDGEIPDCWK